MTTADWALVVSLCSFTVALAGFVWNVWSKFIYPKANVRAHIGIYLIMDLNGDPSPPRKFIQLSAINYGPTEITLRSHLAKQRRPWLRRNRQYAVINPIAHPDAEQPTGWVAPELPKKLAVGDSAAVMFSAFAPKGWVENGDLYYFGFTDTFGRMHWCSRKNARKFRADVIKDFGAVPPVKPSWWRLFEYPGGKGANASISHPRDRRSQADD